MKYVIKNISNNTLDILGKFIYPNDEIQINNINPYKKLITSGFLKILREEKDQLIVLDKTQVNEKINEYNTNHKIINTINNKFPIKKETNENTLYNQEYINEQINNAVNEKINILMNQYNSNSNKDVDTNINLFIKEKIANQDILVSLFHFYIDHKVSEKDLKNIKYFLINISELKNIPDNLKHKINNTLTDEELIMVLLNDVYPYLFSLI